MDKRLTHCVWFSKSSIIQWYTYMVVHRKTKCYAIYLQLFVKQYLPYVNSSIASTLWWWKSHDWENTGRYAMYTPLVLKKAVNSTQCQFLSHVHMDIIFSYLAACSNKPLEEISCNKKNKRCHGTNQLMG